MLRMGWGAVLSMGNHHHQHVGGARGSGVSREVEEDPEAMLVIHGHRQDAAWQRRRGEVDGGRWRRVPSLSLGTSDQPSHPADPRCSLLCWRKNEKTRPSVLPNPGQQCSQGV